MKNEAESIENQINELNLDQKIEKRESRLFPIDQKDLSIDSDDEFYDIEESQGM